MSLTGIVECPAFLQLAVAAKESDAQLYPNEVADDDTEVASEDDEAAAGLMMLWVNDDAATIPNAAPRNPVARRARSAPTEGAPT